MGENENEEFRESDYSNFYQSKYGNEHQLYRPEVRKVIYSAVKKGLPTRLAARIAGIGETTFYNWQRQANKDAEENITTIYTTFFDDLRRAQAEEILQRVERISQHAEKDWKADAFLLTSKHQEFFSKQENKTINNLIINDPRIAQSFNIVEIPAVEVITQSLENLSDDSNNKNNNEKI